MSSSTVTVNPKRRSTQSPPPSTQQANQSKGTVLLRTPLPKYGFESTLKNKQRKAKGVDYGDKVISKTAEILPEKKVPNVGSAENNTETDQTSTDNAGDAECVPIGVLVSSFPQNPTLPNNLLQCRSETRSSKADTVEQQGGYSVLPKDKPVNKVGPISKSSDNTLTHSVSDSVLGVQSGLNNVSLPVDVQSRGDISSRNSDNNVTSANVPSPSEALTKTDSHVGAENQASCSSGSNAVEAKSGAGSQPTAGCRCAGKINQLEEEKQLLKNQLEVQLQVGINVLTG